MNKLVPEMRSKLWVHRRISNVLRENKVWMGSSFVEHLGTLQIDIWLLAFRKVMQVGSCSSVGALQLLCEV